MRVLVFFPLLGKGSGIHISSLKFAQTFSSKALVGLVSPFSPPAP